MSTKMDVMLLQSRAVKAENIVCIDHERLSGPFVSFFLIGFIKVGFKKKR